MSLSSMVSPPPRYNVLTEDDSGFEGKTETLESSQQPRSSRRGFPISGVLIAVLTFIIFIFCALLIDSRKDLHRARTELGAARSEGGEMTSPEYPGSEGGHGLVDAYGIFPEFGFENRLFGLSKEYEENDSRSTEAWEIFQTSSSSTNLRIAR